MEEKNKAELLADRIYDSIMKEHNRLGLVVTNRAVSFDFARLFKETAMDYSVPCVLVERLFLKSDCEMEKKIVQKLPDEAVEIRNQIITLAYTAMQDDTPDEEKIKKLEEADELEKKLAEYELIDTEVELLTYSPFKIENDSIVVLDLAADNFSKLQYRSFCVQMAYFAFNYFSAMVMIPSSSLNIDVVPIVGTSYIDILCVVRS